MWSPGNFGPRVAQVAAVALMVDYVVTVAVQTAAGSAAILSTFPALARPLGDTTTLTLIAVTATLIMCYVNLLGVRENGRTFALPTYLFSGSVGLMIIAGLYREAFGGGLPHVTWQQGTVPAGHHSSGLLTFAAIYILGRAFANGGSSLTGIEAVSNAVSALRPPEGRNARQLLVTQGVIVAFLIAGISWLAHITHAVPYNSGVPTVVSQEASLVFGSSAPGRVLFFLVQAGAISILFTGGNTSFSGFPFLTSFVAEDSFLPPRQDRSEDRQPSRAQTAASLARADFPAPSRSSHPAPAAPDLSVPRLSRGPLTPLVGRRPSH